MKNLDSLRNKITEERSSNLPCITISSGTCGQARGSVKVIQAFQDALEKHKLEDKIKIKVTGCHGFCEAEPNIIIYPDEIFYHNVDPEDAEEIILETVMNQKIIDRLIYSDMITGEKTPYFQDISFYKKQYRLIMGNNSLIDPTSIDDYLFVGGYKSLEKVLSQMNSELVIETIKKSGLRGRGGGGFPTGYKWSFCRKAKGDIKYVICNADEGDPGAYMDRSLLEGNPHSVLEGMIIGAFAIGAKEGWIYVREEYPLAVKNITIAINQARELGLLGKDILGSGFDFYIKIAKGAGAFVCGEETALIASIEGKRGVPRQRPPFPVQKGLHGKPTNINNVETWANIPLIIDKGADWFASIGSEKSKGTKIFSLVGKVKDTGLVEIPMGISLREIIYDIGRGIPDGRRFKAVQTGGPSGGCIPKEMINLPIDYDSLTQAGSIMGSGGMIVMDESTCMVDIAKYFLTFLLDESCGKCLPCRKGIQKMLEIVTDITDGKGKEEDLETLEELAYVIKDTSLCGLGQTAPNSVLSTLRYFRQEYLDHIIKKRCEAAVCKNIISSPCQHTCPIDTEAPLYIALIARKRYEESLDVIKKENPFASVVARVCHHPCESKCRAGEAGKPVAIRGLKRFVTDYGLKHGLCLKTEAVVDKNKDKIAIIGSGPAGLTCAFYLAKKGYQATVFEKLSVVGGMLTTAIPKFRLPREILNADLEFIKSSGFEIQTEMELGRDFTIQDLYEQNFKAIFIATGGHKSWKLGIPNEDSKGVIYGLEVLKDINMDREINVGKKVGIVGGGNSAVDAARALLRKGLSNTVTIYYRRTINEMPAYQEEIDAALEEGIKIKFLTAPTKIISQNGVLKGCEFVKMELGEVDASGRRKPVPIEGSEFFVELDNLVVAISEYPDTSFLDKGTDLQVTEGGNIVVDSETLQTTQEGIFAGGDIVVASNTVIQAIAAGKIASESIEQFLTGEKVKREYKLNRPSKYIEPFELSEEELQEIRSQVMPYLSPEERKSNFGEVELGFDEVQAIKEAKLCLRCDLETEEGQQFLEELKSKKEEAR